MRNDLQHGHAPQPLVGGVAGPLPLYRKLVRRDQLAFDIGANVGDHTRVLLKLGCRVVAVEPQAVAQHIPAEATVIRAVCGATVGTATLYPCTPNPYVSTVMPQFREQVQAHWTYDYGPGVEVEQTTLDALIDLYGVPDFCKIDVEGAEQQVLEGLSVALPLLSFEVHDFDRSKAEVCMGLLDELGDYTYAYAPTESFLPEPWPPERLAIYGDVYATLLS